MYTRKRRFLTDGGPVCVQEAEEGAKSVTIAISGSSIFTFFILFFYLYIPVTPSQTPFRQSLFPRDTFITLRATLSRHSTRYIMFIHTRVTLQITDDLQPSRQELFNPARTISTEHFVVLVLLWLIHTWLRKKMYLNVVSQKSWTTSILRDSRTCQRITLFMRRTGCMGFVSAATVCIEDE